jgi:hypothetical protein
MATVALLGASAALVMGTASAATLTVTESATNVRLGSGIVSPSSKAALVYFGGMRSPGGNPRGHIMGYEDLPQGGFARSLGSTLVFAFGSGPRMVAQASSTSPLRNGAPRPLVGGTGKYLGATGTVRTSAVRGRYTHVITYSLPARGAKRMTFSNIVAYGSPTVIQRGGPGGVGDTRAIGGSLTDASGAPNGRYTVGSVLTHVYSGGLYQWYVADGTFTFADGSTLHAVGPFQRATGSAPGVLAAAPEIVHGGTGRFAGMRGQVVFSRNPDGTSTCTFTLVK